LLQELVKLRDTENILPKLIKCIIKHPYPYKRKGDGSIWIDESDIKYKIGLPFDSEDDYESDSEDEIVADWIDESEPKYIGLPLDSEDELPDLEDEIEPLLLDSEDDELSEFIEACKTDHCCEYFNDFWKSIE